MSTYVQMLSTISMLELNISTGASNLIKSLIEHYVFLYRSKDYDNVSEDIPLQSYFQIGRIHGIKYLTSHKKYEK